MSGATRQRLMRWIVAGVLLWPIPHRVLVETWEVDPWELFGWAMYSEPAARVQVRVDRLRGDRREPLRAMGELRDAIRGFAQRRTILGKLASPDALAGRVLAADPEADGLVVVMRRIRLDPRSRMLVTEEVSVAYARGGDGRPSRLEDGAGAPTNQSGEGWDARALPQRSSSVTTMPSSARARPRSA